MTIIEIGSIRLMSGSEMTTGFSDEETYGPASSRIFVEY
jgi:hypothetical protein